MLQVLATPHGGGEQAAQGVPEPLGPPWPAGREEGPKAHLHGVAADGEVAAGQVAGAGALLGVLGRVQAQQRRLARRLQARHQHEPRHGVPGERARRERDTAAAAASAAAAAQQVAELGQRCRSRPERLPNYFLPPPPVLGREWLHCEYVYRSSLR